jgi:4-hydroxy-tetrahydrodipicolinate synthase
MTDTVPTPERIAGPRWAEKPAPTRAERQVVRCLGMVATPFVEGAHSVDEESLVDLAGSFTRAGCSALVALGVIGEPSTLTPEEKLRVVRTTASSSAVPVIAGVITQSLLEMEREAADLAAQCGSLLSGLMLPVLSSNAEELRASLCRVHEVTGLPVLVQDLPQHSGTSIDVADLADALEGLDFVSGIKCEAPPTFRRIAYLAERGFTGLISGFGGIGVLDDLLSGADGLAIGVTIPETLAQVVEQWRQGNDRGAATLLGSYALRIHYETQPGQSIAIRKEHWRRQGVIRYSDVRRPTPPWTPDLEPLSAGHGMGGRFPHR